MNTISTISYKNKKYPTRTLTWILDDEEVTYTISVESLVNAFGDTVHKDGSRAQQIDDTLYAYVPDEVIHLSGEEICKNHLDEEFVFVRDEDEI